jgi:pantothenate kinase
MSIEPTPTQSMPPLLTQPVKRLVAQLKTTPSRWMLAVAGMPGSGKTTLASHLVEAINMRVAPNTAVALGMDGFHFTKAALRQFPNHAEAFARRGAPWTFDAFALQQRLQLLRTSAGRADIPWPAFEHAVGDPLTYRLLCERPKAYVLMVS